MARGGGGFGLMLMGLTFMVGALLPQRTWHHVGEEGGRLHRRRVGSHHEPVPWVEPAGWPERVRQAVAFLPFRGMLFGVGLWLFNAFMGHRSAIPGSLVAVAGLVVLVFTPFELRWRSQVFPS